MTEQKPYQSPTLDAVRRKIDTLDNQIHDILMERAELINQISAEKKKNDIPVVQPAREARMIRRLLTRHKGSLPEMAVVRIWRELVGAVSMLQTGLKVIVAQPENQPDLWDLSKDYFGSCLPMNRIASPLAAISAVREGAANMAVLPWPEEGDANPWWAYLDNENPDQKMQIIVRLPHGDDPSEKNPDCRGLVVAKEGFRPSDDDRSFLMIACESGISRARLVDSAKKVGLTALSMSSNRAEGPYQPALHLMEVEGYVCGDHDVHTKLADVIEDPQARVVCVGGYPVPPVYNKTIRVNDTAIPSAPREKQKA